MKVSLLFTFVLIGLVYISVATLYGVRTLLSNTRSLTFYNDQYTHTLNVPSKSQMVCMSPTGLCIDAHFRSITCYNKGRDIATNEILWNCQENFGLSGYSVSSANVVCESYDGVSSEYVVAGSCRVEYNVAQRGGYFVTRSTYPDYNGFITFVFLLFLLGGCAYVIIVCTMVSPTRTSTTYRQSRRNTTNAGTRVE